MKGSAATMASRSMWFPRERQQCGKSTGLRLRVGEGCWPPGTQDLQALGLGTQGSAQGILKLFAWSNSINLWLALVSQQSPRVHFLISSGVPDGDITGTRHTATREYFIGCLPHKGKLRLAARLDSSVLLSSL